MSHPQFEGPAGCHRGERAVNPAEAPVFALHCLRVSVAATPDLVVPPADRIKRSRNRGVRWAVVVRSAVERSAREVQARDREPDVPDSACGY